MIWSWSQSGGSEFVFGQVYQGSFWCESGSDWGTITPPTFPNPFFHSSCLAVFVCISQLCFPLFFFGSDFGFRLIFYVIYYYLFISNLIVAWGLLFFKPTWGLFHYSCITWSFPLALIWPHLTKEKKLYSLWLLNGTVALFTVLTNHWNWPLKEILKNNVDPQSDAHIWACVCALFIFTCRSPAMAGGLFAIERDFFFEMGLYDPGLQIWGGENFEISYKVEHFQPEVKCPALLKSFLKHHPN